MKQESGFTLIEVIVSISLFGIMLSTLPTAFISFMRFNTQMELRSQAMAAAQYVLDEMRLENPQTMPTSGVDSEVVTIGSRNFLVNIRYCTNAAFCGASTMRHIAVQVDYGEQDDIYAVETVFTKLK